MMTTGRLLVPPWTPYNRKDEARGVHGVDRGPRLRRGAGRGRPAAPHPRRMVSQAMADSLGRKLDAIEKRYKARSAKPETVVVTEGELNSYLALTLASE